jgi:hypothetical protein
MTTAMTRLKAKSNSPIGMEPASSNCSGLGCDGPPSFVLWGDSHAMAIASLCDELARSRGLSGQCLAASGIFPLLGTWNDRPTAREIQLEWNRRVVEWIKRNKVANVIIVARWEWAVPSRFSDWRARDKENRRMMFIIKDDNTRAVSNEDSRRVLQEHFDETISALQSPDRRVWLVMQVPVQNDLPGGRSTRGVPAKTYEQQQYEINRVLKGSKWPMVSVIESGQSWFDSDGFSYVGDSGGSYYIDKDHVSSYGAKKLLGPLLEPVFDRIKRDLRFRLW